MIFLAMSGNERHMAHVRSADCTNGWSGERFSLWMFGTVARLVQLLLKHVIPREWQWFKKKILIRIMDGRVSTHTRSAG